MQTSSFDGRLKLRLGAILLSFLIPTLVFANANIEDEEAANSGTDRPFAIKERSQFACAEVSSNRNGGTVSHEINLTPSNVERCLLIKVGSRLHECNKFRFETATVDETGVVKIHTDEGPVNFWYDQDARITTDEESKVAEGAGKGALTFIFPDKQRKYLCAAMR